MLQVGNKAPSFSLLNQNDEKTSFEKGKWSVVYFYPKALTPGCTVQAEGITAAKEDFAKLGVPVFAISPDAPEKLKRFEEKKALSLNLLSDPELATIKAYGAWGRKKFMGKEFDGVLRSTFIINPEGEIAYVMDKVKTKTHNEDVLEILKGLM